MNWSTATPPIDSENLNKSVVSSPIDLENSNLSVKKVSQKCSQYDLFDSEKGSKNDKNSKRPKKWRREIKQKQHNNSNKDIHQMK